MEWESAGATFDQVRIASSASLAMTATCRDPAQGMPVRVLPVRASVIPQAIPAPSSFLRSLDHVDEALARLSTRREPFPEGFAPAPGRSARQPIPRS
jgi:hypothetical protein